MRIVEGVDSLLQLSGMLARLCSKQMDPKLFDVMPIADWFRCQIVDSGYDVMEKCIFFYLYGSNWIHAICYAGL